MAQLRPETDPAYEPAQTPVQSFTIEEETTDHQLERFILEALEQRQDPGEADKPQSETFVVSPPDDTTVQLSDSCTVLVVEDHVPTQSLERFILEEAGYTVNIVPSGEEALDFLRHNSCDIVLMDVGLPRMDGFATCRRLRQTSQIPIMMVTGRDCIEDQVRALAAGADDYLSKSFMSKELATRVEVLLQLASRKGKHDNKMTVVEELDELYEGDIHLIANIYGSIRTAVDFVGQLRENQQFHALRVVTHQRQMDISLRIPYPLPIKRLLLQRGLVSQITLADDLPSTFNSHTFRLSIM